MDSYVDVIIPLALDQLFTYHIEEPEQNKVQSGSRVAVPFGKSKVYTGIAAQLHNEPPLHYQTKPVELVLDEAPFVTKEQLLLWQWMSNYYLAPIGLIMKTALPSSMLLESETSIALTPNDELDKDKLSDNEYLIVEALEKRSEMRVDDIQGLLGIKTVLPILYQLVRKNIINLKQALVHQYQPKMIRVIHLNDIYEDKKVLDELFEKLRNAEKQKKVLLCYFQLRSQKKHFLQRKDLARAAETTVGTVKNLMDKNILIEKEVQEDRTFKDHSSSQKKLKLSEAQEKARLAIKEEFQKDKACLLHGVTSSGKTEVYIRLIDEVLQQGKQALYLVPEIALTTQLIDRLEAYFGDQVLIYHSKNQPSVSVEVYQHLLRPKKAFVVIGVRSAIFLPFQDLGLIVVDESHEGSFKQQDPAPRYHARNVALYMSRIHHANILLGSATPSLESLYNVKKRKLGDVRLEKRHGNIQLPDIALIDLGDKMKKKKMKGHFSDQLIQEIEDQLKKDQQVLLFQNRRGHSPMLECQTCGFTPQCK